MKLSLSPRSFLISASIVLVTGASLAASTQSASSSRTDGSESGSPYASSTYGTNELGSFIGSATRAALWYVAAHETAPPRPGVVEVLDEPKVSALLKKLDLRQLPNGSLSKCTGRQWYVFLDRNGVKLGRLTFDGCNPRFDSADGKVMGDIRAQL